MVKDLVNRFNMIFRLFNHTMAATVTIVAKVFGAKMIIKYFMFTGQLA
jgi:sialic acid synthase SpsE